jgi:RHS repeat-associated protein
LTDGRWTYTWDAENRLITLSNNASVPSAAKMTLNFGYDYYGRRISKVVSNYVSGSYVVLSNTKFVYDGWNLLDELNGTNNAVIRAYMWGTDLSGSMQGAGGVGGLLAISGTNSQFTCFDGNGNITALVDTTSSAVTGQYEYGPFGETIRISGSAASGNPCRFSTKYTDAETDFLYYGYRYYNPNTGRWVGRDPMDEAGDLNLYGFVQNTPANAVDSDGQELVYTPTSYINNVAPPFVVSPYPVPPGNAPPISNNRAYWALAFHFFVSRGAPFRADSPEWISFIKAQPDVQAEARKKILEGIRSASEQCCALGKKHGAFGGVVGTQINPTRGIQDILNMGMLGINGRWTASADCKTITATATFNYWDEIIPKPNAPSLNGKTPLGSFLFGPGGYPNNYYRQWGGESGELDNKIAAAIISADAINDAIIPLPIKPAQFEFQSGSWVEHYIFTVDSSAGGDPVETTHSWPFTPSP